MLLQHSHCDSAPMSVARTAVVRVLELSGDCYVSGKRVTGDGAGPLQPASAPRAVRGKEGGMKWEWFQLSCAHFIAGKPARKMSCSLPRWLQTFLRCLVKKNSNSAQLRKHLKQKLLFCPNSTQRSSHMLPACHYAICQQFTTQSSAQRNNVCTLSPSESSNPVTTLTRREAISCAAQLTRFFGTGTGQ